MAIIRPRLTDQYGVLVNQAETDFAIPFLEEDIPLYVDPFLLWKSPSYQDKALHNSIINAFNHLGFLCKKGKHDEALHQLIVSSECDEVGLGVSATRTGKRIGEGQARGILKLFDEIPEYNSRGFTHFEEIQFFIEGISKDRISDITCSLMKSFLIDYTIDQCNSLGIPMLDCSIRNVYDLGSYNFKDETGLKLPISPISGRPILLTPKRWLRYSPWIDFDDYFKSCCPLDEIINPGVKPERVKVLNFNRDNYGVVESYVREKERAASDCINDPLFRQIPIISAKRKIGEIKKLPSGKEGNADKAYEDAVCQLMASLMYPHLDFAQEQSRTESGTLIRDLIFYNNRSHPFLSEIYSDYGSRQIVMELKNVAAIERDHINQLNRYLADELGNFGVLITRHELPKARKQNLIDLWSGQRKCIITLTDSDLNQMVELFESNQRQPIDVLKKKYIEFRRVCPS